jgi:hypothetical protein
VIFLLQFLHKKSIITFANKRTKYFVLDDNRIKVGIPNLVQVINSTFKPKKNTIKKPYVGSNDATADATMLRIVFEKNVYLRVIVTMLNIEVKI